MTLIEEVYVAALPEMAAHGIEDITVNRLSFLAGMLSAWKEDSDNTALKQQYVQAVENEIDKLTRLLNE